jgi:hypothetical protein
MEARRMKLSTLAALAALLLTTPLHAATITLPVGGDLRAAVNKALPGDVIELAPGGSYPLQMELPAKSAGGLPITIRTAGTLPDRRVGRADAPLLANITAGGANGPTLTCGTTCAQWKFEGVEFNTTPTFVGGEIIILEGAKWITFDRVLVWTPGGDVKRGIRANGDDITVTRSYIGDVWNPNQDSQALCQWWGTRLKVTDSTLVAASENLLVGGADSPTAATMPSDVLVEGSTFTKPEEWRGQPRIVKNLFELKAVRRAQVRNNLFEKNWVQGQSGYAIVLTTRNQEGSAPWSAVEDVVFERNVIRDTPGGLNILGVDNEKASGRATRLTIRHNLWQTTGGVNFIIGGEAGAVEISNNTIANSGTTVYFYKGQIWPAGTAAPRDAAFAVETLTYRDNLAYHRSYGFHGADAAPGPQSIAMHVKNPIVWGKNVLAGTENAGLAYPAVTLRPTEAEHAAQFAADYSLVAGSTYRGAGANGGDLGWGGANVVIPPPPPPPPDPVVTDPQEPPPPPPPAEDATGPVILSVTATRSGGSSNYTFTVRAQDAGSGIARVEVWVGTRLQFAVSQPSAVGGDSYTGKGWIGVNGTHTLRVVAYDQANNQTTKEQQVVRK